MPIHYACILNCRSVIVLQGVYASTQTFFNTQVVQNSNRIVRFGFSEVPLKNSDLRIVYHNWDMVTAAIVASHEVDKQECGEFLENFKNHVESTALGKPTAYEAPGTLNDSQHLRTANAELY